jgi:CRP-like cAMP-binding protein
MESNAARLIRKLEHGVTLGNEEKRALEEACNSVQRFAARDELVKEGDPAQAVHLVLDGYACRYKLLSDGRRQIIGYFLPGDLCDVRVCVLKRIDHSIGTLSVLKAAVLSRDNVLGLIERFPRLARAFWWTTLVDESITREWVVNVGHRTAFERAAHLFCEIFARLQAVGLATENSCELPVTQTELADALALSAVHVNRVLMEMRHTGLVTFRAQRLTIHDHDALRSVAGFNPAYLYLDSSLAAAHPELESTG